MVAILSAINSKIRVTRTNATNNILFVCAFDNFRSFNIHFIKLRN